jgi:hypothetical protein
MKILAWNDKTLAWNYKSGADLEAILVVFSSHRGEEMITSDLTRLLAPLRARLASHARIPWGRPPLGRELGRGIQKSS